MRHFGPPKIERLISKRDVERLIEVLREYPDRREEAARGLARLRAEEAVDTLVDCMREDLRSGLWARSGFGLVAAEALLEIAEPRGIHAVFLETHNDDDEHRKAVEAIVEMADVSGLVLVLNQGRRAADRRRAAHALARLGDPRGREYLEREVNARAARQSEITAAAEKLESEVSALREWLAESIGGSVKFDFYYCGEGRADTEQGIFVYESTWADPWEYRSGFFTLLKGDWRRKKSAAANAILNDYFGEPGPKQRPRAAGGSFQQEVIGHLLVPPFVRNRTRGEFNLSPFYIERWAYLHRDLVVYPSFRSRRPKPLEDAFRSWRENAREDEVPWA